MTTINDKDGEPIRRGDYVFMTISEEIGGHEGMVDKVVTSEEDAADEGVEDPPKVSFWPVNIMLPL